MKFVPCAVDGKTKPDPAATFTLGADGSLKVGTGGCVGVGHALGFYIQGRRRRGIVPGFGMTEKIARGVRVLTVAANVARAGRA